MFSQLLRSIFPDRYEERSILKIYIRSQYGPFLKKNPYHKSEEFYQKLITESVSYINHDTCVLDVGCATGRLVFEYEKMGAQKSCGIDTSRRFIDFCTSMQRGECDRDISFKPAIESRAQFLCGDVLDAPLESASMTFISCINVIDRVRDPRVLIARLHTLLKDNGVLLIVDPYDWKLSPAHKERHVSDMKMLFDRVLWIIEKKMRDIQYVTPINQTKDKIYQCHLIIARKKRPKI